MASNKEKAYALNYVISLAESVRLHHPKKCRHAADEVCLAEYHRDRQVYLVRKMFEEYKSYGET